MTLLRWIGTAIVILWILGFLFKIGGTMIHWLIVAAAVVFIYDLIVGRRKT